MNIIIEKNYNIKVKSIIQKKENYMIKTKYTDYELIRVEKKELYIILLNIDDQSRSRIVNTKYGNYYINIREKYYILIEFDKREYIDIMEIMNESKEIYNEKFIDYSSKWELKNDYIEEYLKNSNNELILEVKDYYFGLAEQAIVIYRSEKNSFSNFVICHKRINKKAFRLPNNVVIDCKEREIAEYIKYLIFDQSMHYEEIIKIINKYIIDKYNLHLITARLLYPSEFFDLIDDDREGLAINNKIIKLINKEKIRHKIILYINKKRDAPFNRYL